MSASDQDEKALELLRPYKDSIAGTSDLQKVRFVAATWSDWLRQANWPKNDINELLDRVPGERVSRPKLRALARTAKGDRDRRFLLVATLIWGRGRRNGRMRDHIVELLQHPDLGETLELTGGLAAEGSAAAAYRSWQLPGLREPFFTKWLWAASCASDTSNRCLVLDRRVWSSLNGALDWVSIEAAGSRRRADRYGAYVDRCHQWAEALGSSVSAEDVECALFIAAGDLGRLADDVGVTST